MDRLEHEHTVEAIRERLSSAPRQYYLRDWIYGGIDGSVTTFAVVSGVAGARLSAWVIMVMGFANLLADGFSMAASNFMATRAEDEDFKRLTEIERRHIELVPEGEREELREIFRRKGFSGQELTTLLVLITSDRDRWVNTMLTEEYGQPQNIRSPLIAAAATFSAFLVCGLVPLIPYLLHLQDALIISALFTGAVFFAIGSFKSRWSTTSWWISGLSTFAVGAIAAALAFAAGLALQSLAGH